MALDGLSLLTELVIEAWRLEPTPRHALLRLSGEGVRKRRDRKRLLG